MASKRSVVRILSAFVLGGAMIAACGGDAKNSNSTPPKNGTEPEAKTNDAPAAAAKAGGAGGEKVKVVEGAPPGGDDRYALQIDTPQAKVGEPSKVVVKVVPKAPWHMNLDFPTSLEVEPPSGVAVDKPAQKKADAVTFDENAAQFDVAFTASQAGEQQFTGKFKFAVCQDEACSPVTEDVAFKVAVK